METEVAGTCLSYDHIRAEGAVEDTPARLVLYTNGSFGKVTRELETRTCACGEQFQEVKRKSEEQCFMCREITRECVVCGDEFKVTNREFRTQDVLVCPSCGGENEGCKRGTVTRFSESSKRRLMQLLNKVQRDVSEVMFVTLTFPDEYYDHSQDPDHWKECLRVFEWRFRRAFPGASFVWRLECETRKSGEHVGEVFPHFHLLVFGVPLVELRPFVAENWYEIAGCGNEEHFRVHRHGKAVTAVLTRNGVLSYAAKAVGSVMSRELAKSLQAKGENVGRWWGVICKEVFETFLAIPEEFELTDRDACSLMRTFRKYVQAQVREKWVNSGKLWKKPCRKAFQVRSTVVFLNGTWLRDNLLRMLSPGGSWCYTATGRRYNVPFYEHILNQVKTV